MKLLFIINPISGSSDKTFLFDHINQLQGEKNNEVVCYETQPEGNVENIKEKIDSFNPDRIVVAGGDGTLQLVSKCIVESKSNASLGIIPMGSANGLATCLNLPKTPEEALDVAITSKNILAIDVLLIDEKHYCVHLFDLGTNALLIKYYEADKMRGMLGYSKHLLSAIEDSKQYKFTIRSGNQIVQKSARMLIGTNGNKYGTGVVISNGSISDGYFDLTTIQEFNLEEIIKSSLSILDIQLNIEQFDNCIKSKEAIIEATESVPLQIDGEYMGEVTKLRVNVLASAIKVVMNE